MSTDHSTHTSDATRETRGEPAQGVTQASNGNNTGSVVVMEGDSVGESSLEHSNPSDQTAEGGSRQRENHVKSGTSNRLSLSSTSRGGFWRKRRHKSMPWPSPRKRHQTGIGRRR